MWEEEDEYDQYESPFRTISAYDKGNAVVIPQRMKEKQKSESCKLLKLHIWNLCLLQTIKNNSCLCVLINYAFFFAKIVLSSEGKN